MVIIKITAAVLNLKISTLFCTSCWCIESLVFITSDFNKYKFSYSNTNILFHILSKCKAQSYIKLNPKYYSFVNTISLININL